MIEFEVPDSWAACTLSSIGTWLGGKTPSKANPKFWTNGTVPWVSPKDMKVDRINDAEDKITTLALSDGIPRIPAQSVLLVVRSGILAHSFPVAICTREVTINQDLKAFVPNKAVTPEFIFWTFRALERSIIQNYTKRGATVQSIDFDSFKLMGVPIPPLAEQRRIIDKVESSFAKIGELETVLNHISGASKGSAAALSLIETLKTSILLKAISGRLVPQIAAEGTGHELLSKGKEPEEIEKKKVSKPKAKKTSRKSKPKRAKK